MAKKSRVPPPPRPVQAPKRRTDPKPPRTNRRYLIIAAVAALVIVGTAVAALVPRLGGSADDAKAAMVDAGCTYRTYPATTSKHVRETAKVKYNSFPPTNGEMTDEMIIFGFYTEPIVDQKPLIHNLEHGAVAIQYGRRVGPDTVAQLEELYRDDPNGLVVAQLPALRDKIALGAWNAPEPTGASGAKPDLGEGILALCPRFDESAFKTFIAKHRYMGPERPPRETLEPGAGH